MIELKILGSGNSAGMPVYGCTCKYCKEAALNPPHRRTPASGTLRIGDKFYLLDAGRLDLMELFPAGSIDGIFITHFHMDHVQSLFPLRWGLGDKLPVYIPPDEVGSSDLFKYPRMLEFNKLKQFEFFNLGPLRITPVPLIHTNSMPTFGYIFDVNNVRLAYLTDTLRLPPKTHATLKKTPADVIVIDCSYEPGVPSTGHNNLDIALEIFEELKPGKMILTHISHDFHVWLRQNPGYLPNGVEAGKDGMVAYSGQL